MLDAASRPLRLRMRPDLATERQTYQGQAYWLVKDPVTLKYYRFHEEEFAILQMLDGRTSPAEIRRRFEQRFPPQKITLEELMQLVGSLHRSGLILSDVSGQAEALLTRRRETSRRQRLASLTNVLAVRFRGIDPDRMLSWLSPYVGWLFSLPATIVGILFGVAAATLISVQFAEFTARLPAFDRFFAAENWLWLALTLAVTKVLHELGHGLVCKRLGGTCHEMGVMLLVLTPCLYVNVSDSWMLPNKWHRAAIGAAGMYVELVLASVCTFLWWFSEPGLLNYLCLNVMFIASVSTVLFNGNPLLRYDGYYILADLIEIPNLRSKSSAVLRQKLGHWLLGLDERPDPFLPQRHQWFFALYTVAAAVYRWVVCLSILWFLNRVFEPYGLQIIGQLIAVVAIYGLAIHPLWQLARFFSVPGRMETVNRRRAWMSGAALAAAVAAALAVPLPYHVESPFRLEPRDAASVYVNVPGRLQRIHVRGGQRVEPGQPLVTLTNADVELAVAKLKGRREELIVRVADLQRRQFLDPQAAMELAEAQESLSGIDEQLARRRRDLEALQLIAPVGGEVMPPPKRPRRPSPDELPDWSGTPLDGHNVGAALGEGVLICRVGDQCQLQAIIDVDQSNIEFVCPEQVVELKFDALPSDTFVTQVAHVAQLERERRRQSEQNGPLARGDNPEGGVYRKSLNTKFQASAPLVDGEEILFAGATGKARIRAGYQTIAQRLWRYLSQTFRFRA